MGELKTEEYYINNGFSILFKNWRWSNKGEIDIIAYNKFNDLLVVCEVKTRKSSTLLRGCYSVNYKKQQKIKLLTAVFLKQNMQFYNSFIRFDVADVIFDYKNLSVREINIIENAF